MEKHASIHFNEFLVCSFYHAIVLRHLWRGDVMLDPVFNYAIAFLAAEFTTTAHD
jgi:hypothetical protein